MKYKLIACDFDGTLSGDDFKISNTNIEAIKKYRADGGIFVISTGRLYSAVKDYLEIMGIKEGFAICHQGASIFDIKTNKLLKEKGIVPEVSFKLFEYLESLEKAIPIMFYGDDAYSHIVDDNVEYFANIMKRPVYKLNNLISEKIKKENLLATKMLTMIKPDYITQTIDELRVKFSDYMVFNQAFEFMIEGVDKDASKGNAVKELGEILGIKREEILAIGDDQNDISMLKYAGLGVAVDNASAIVKESADVVTKSNNDHGVAHAIKKYVYGEIE